MWQSFQWIWQNLSRWGVVAFGSSVLLGFAVTAMYGDEYLAAAFLYFMGIAYLTAKSLGWEETRRHAQRKAITILILALAAILFAGSLLWISHRHEHVRELSGLSTRWFVTAAVTGAWSWIRILNRPWQRIEVFVIAAAALILLGTLMPTIRRLISAKKARNVELAGAEKGYLDYKLQTEESMQRLILAVSKVTDIIEQVGPTMLDYTHRLAAISPSSTRQQVDLIAKAARSLDQYSKGLDAICSDLERAADSMTDGLSGWLSWLKTQRRKDAEREIVLSLSQLQLQLTSNIALFDNYLIAVENVRGASREMNRAVDSHLRSFGRVRTASERIRTSCLDNLQLLESSPT